MADYGHNYTEKQLEVLEKRFQAVYGQAEREVNDKLMDYLHKYKAKDDAKRKLLDEGKITEKEYKDWRYGQMMTGKRWKEMRDQLAQDYTNANKNAIEALNHRLPDVFAENTNYSMYDIENRLHVDTSFTLYDRQTVDRLLRDNPDLVKMPELDDDKDLKWNKQHIQSAVEQGVLQGESIPKIAKRLGYVTKSEKAAATRTARTAMTSAQNGGRIESYNRAKALGIDLKKCWLATMDGRVRHEHAALDGQTVDTDKPFKMAGTEIMFPGDPSAPGFMVWNCRCTLIAQLKGFEHDVSQGRFSRLENMSYDEWKKYHTDKLGINQAVTKAIQSVGATFANTKGLHSGYAQGLSDALKKSPYKEVRDIYERYQDELVCVDGYHRGGAFFRNTDGGIHFNMANDMAGNKMNAPYEVGFHEFGHNIDWLLGGKNNYDYASNLEYNGVRLIDVLKKDYKDFRKSLGITNNKDFITHMQREGLSLRQKGNISDVLEGLTNTSYPLGVGHGAKYHKRPGATEKEFFAEVLDSAAVNPDGFEQMERLFPNGVKMVFDIIGGRL